MLPVALDKGIGRARGCCSLWLVWVRLTIWIHGTVITTPPLPPPSFWSLSFHLALPPDTLFAYRVVIAPSHPRVTRLTVRGIPPDCYRVAPHHILSIRFHRRLAGPSRRYREDSATTVTLAYRWIPNDRPLRVCMYVYASLVVTAAVLGFISLGDVYGPPVSRDLGAILERIVRERWIKIVFIIIVEDVEY